MEDADPPLHRHAHIIRSSEPVPRRIPTEIGGDRPSSTELGATVVALWGLVMLNLLTLVVLLLLTLVVFILLKSVKETSGWKSRDPRPQVGGGGSSVPTPGKLIILLRDFLRDSFKCSDMKSFLIMNGWNCVVYSINENVSDDEWFFSVVQELNRHGLLDARFFKSLIESRPAKKPRITRLAEYFLERDQAPYEPSDWV
jgi:hypothetical protein